MRRRGPPTDALLAALALGSVLALTLLAHVLEPPLVSLAEAAKREGARVAVEARVLDARPGPRARWMELSDGAHRLGAFGPLVPEVGRGDTISGAGVVSRDGRSFLLSLDELSVVQRADVAVRRPDDLAASPSAFDGARVVVRGEVRGGALVGDAARIAMRGDDVPTAGFAVVTGSFRYHEPSAAYVLWVETWSPPS